MKTVFLFSGQGSQYRKMGEALYQTNPVFTASLDRSDAIFRRVIGRSLIEELYHETDENFDDLIVTHPAIVAVEIAMIQLLKEEGIEPDYVSGNSLGEFAAAVAAGIWSHEQALEAAIEQAISIVEGNVAKGGMMAVMTDDEETLLDRLDEHNLYLASKNFPGHYTLSGSAEDLQGMRAVLDQDKISYVILPVNYPFHCSLIEAGHSLFEYYTHLTPGLTKASTKFVSGLYAQPAKQVPLHYFWFAISQQSDFTSLISFMEEEGPCLYVDMGPSGTAATFVKYNLSGTSQSRAHIIMSPYKREIAQLASLKKILKLAG